MADIGENLKNFFGMDDTDNYKAAPIPERLQKNKKIAIITDENVEDLEFFYPYYRFNEAGYKVDVITSKGGAFKAKNGIELKSSKPISEVNNPTDYDLIYLPGGKAPAKLRTDEKILKFVRDFAATGKPIAAICHGPQILISADLIRGKKVAAWPGIKDEIEEAGSIFANEALQEDGQFITARRPGDLHRHLQGIIAKLERSN